MNLIIFLINLRLSSSYQGLYEGSGLGLYSVREYIGKMQGDINVESIVNKEQSLRFCFRLKKLLLLKQCL